MPGASQEKTGEPRVDPVPATEAARAAAAYGRKPGRSPSFGGAPRFSRKWAGLIPFFLSCFFYVSGLFAIFSPLPLMILGLKPSSRKWLLLAILTNGGLVYFTTGLLSFWIYFVMVLPLVMVLPPLLKRGVSIERAGATALLGVVVTAMMVWLVHAEAHHLAPWIELKRVIDSILSQVLEAMPGENRKVLLHGLSVEEWRQNLYWELPSAVAVFTVVLVWINLTLVLRLNPGHVRERMGIDAGYLRRWKAPEILLWPTIIAGGLSLAGGFEWIHLSWGPDLGLAFFKLFMTIYAIQGLSILSFFFDTLKLRGAIRILLYALAVFVATPLLLSIGFFDLWFDFRAKFRQS